jgi:putative sigma-54 modulation protein
MRLQVKGRNVEVTESIRNYAEAKLGKLDRLVADPTRVELELAVEKNRSIAANHVAEATVWTKGPVLRARESSADMKASIDQLVDKLERQVKRYREKRRGGPRRQARGNGGVVAPPVTTSEGEPMIVKTKQFAVKPMSPEEAVLQLELVGHDFFVFRNSESDEVNVVYRRRDGGYGLIEPQ